jgi:hypothetical protein
MLRSRGLKPLAASESKLGFFPKLLLYGTVFISGGLSEC